MKINREALKTEEGETNWPYACGCLEAYLLELAEKVEKGNDPIAKEYVELLKEKDVFEEE